MERYRYVKHVHNYNTRNCGNIYQNIPKTFQKSRCPSIIAEADLGGGVGGARPPFQGMKPLSWESFLILHAPHTQPHAPTASVLTHQSNIPI